MLMISKESQCNSRPPGALLLHATVPLTSIQLSNSGISVSSNTHCTAPDLSLRCKNWIPPRSRRLWTQPRIVTVVPTFVASSETKVRDGKKTDICLLKEKPQAEVVKGLRMRGN